MQFTELRDERGTTLQSYIELLQEKAREHGFLCVMVFANRGTNQLHTASNIGAPLPLVLRKLAQEMEKEPTETSSTPVVTAPPTVN